MLIKNIIRTFNRSGFLNNARDNRISIHYNDFNVDAYCKVEEAMLYIVLIHLLRWF